MDELLSSITKNLSLNTEQVKEIIGDVIEKCYGDTLDGKCAERYDGQICRLLGLNQANGY
jgi:hypothetical protein